jgi:uncharacterized protein with FMN-binding domain
MPIIRTRTALLTLTGLSALGILTGCSAGAASSGGSPAAGAPDVASSSSAAPDDTASGSASGATYKDGTFTEQGTYSSPGGQEVISVRLEIASDTVKDVEVKTVKADPTATQYEAMFIKGIQGEVVGKKVDDLKVTHVSGSSLTSKGFDDALAKIKSDATA